jgi:hypothetical protein
MKQETRIAKRRRTNNFGILKTDGKDHAVLLRDASATGARVRLVTGGELPERLTLVAPMEKINAACVIVWRRGNDLGLKFEPSPATA